MSSSAVTLGRHSGAAVIGRPLDVRVQVLLAPDEDISNQCITADVFYGDLQVPPNQVRSTPHKSGADPNGSVRIQASAAINEPIVTLYVKAGCGTVFTRRFVLLADPLTEPVAQAQGPVTDVTAPSAPRGATAPTVGAAQPPSGVVARQSGAAVRAAQPVPEGGRSEPAVGSQSTFTPRSGAPRAASTGTVVRRAAQSKAAAPVPAPRLLLDPVDLDAGVERDPTLKLSPLLLSEANATDEARAAAGQLWQSLNAGPEEVLRDARKLAALEAEVAQLRRSSAEAQSTVGDLRVQLEQAREQRFRNGLVYTLGAMLLLALLVLLWLARRKADQGGAAASQAWWSGSPEERAGLVTPLPGAVAKPGTREEGPQAGDHGLDLHLDDVTTFDRAKSSRGAPSAADRGGAAPTAELPSRDRKEFSPSALGGGRSVATEELFDVQQQADFFVSLGEDEQAIQVLRNHLAESNEPSPLAYLDLFKLYHRLGRRADYEALRDEFNHVFNAGAPPFNQYTDGGRGLEAYEAAFSRIQSLWPEPRVLDLIEESIFRDVSDDAVEVFDLEAYRELLLLHAIAKDLIQRDEVPALRPAGSEFGHTNMQPLKAQERPSLAATRAQGPRHTEPMALSTALPASSNLSLDINLDDLSEFSAFEASLPEVSPPVEPTAMNGMHHEPGNNLIDFEVLDFTPPGDEPKSGADGKP